MAQSSHKFYQPGADITGEATEILAPCRFVKVSTVKVDGANVKLEYADGGAGAAGYYWGVTGVEFLAVGDGGDVYRPGAICEVEAGGTVADLALVKITTDGKAIAATATGDVIVGQALKGGVNGDRLIVATHIPTVLKIA